MVTPALRALKQALPETTIVAVGPGVLEKLLGNLPWLDCFLPLQRKTRHRGLTGMWRAAREIREFGAKDGIVFPHSQSSAILLRLAGVRHLLGYWSSGRGFLLSDAPKPILENGKRVPEPMTRHYLTLLKGWGIESSDERLELLTTEAEEAAASAFLQQHGLEVGQFFALNPGASFGASKFWTVDGFASSARQLLTRHGLRSLVLCGPGEEFLARQIAEAAGDCVVDTSSAPLPLELLKPVLRDSRLLVTTDTGPRHIATAFSVPTVVLMGPTDPRYTASNLERTEVLRIDVDCGPCHLKVCPLDHRCMTGLTSDHVLAAADRLLTRFAEDSQESLHA